VTKPQLGLVAVRDRDCRSLITKTLRRLGWTVVEHASGFHVVQALSELITGNAIGPRADLIVVDAISAGCSGVTIAAGFRDLGLAIPIMLIAPAEASEVPVDAYAHSVILVEPTTASIALVAIAKLASVPTEERKRYAH
jgi:CheY-like chemotaxis protein